MDEDKCLDHKKIFEELQGTGEKDKDREKEEEEDVECPDTKIWIWDGDQYEEY